MTYIADVPFACSAAEEEHAIKTFYLQAGGPLFHRRVQLWIFWCQQNIFGIRVLWDVILQCREAGTLIVNQVAGVLQDTILTVSQVSAALFHPHGVGTGGDLRNVHTSESTPIFLSTNGTWPSRRRILGIARNRPQESRRLYITAR